MQGTVDGQMQWHHGQLLAFSGLDGLTDYDNGLVARTVGVPASLEVQCPGLCRVEFASAPSADVYVTSDGFSFRHARGRTLGVMLDAHHLLVCGPCRVTSQADAVQVTVQGERLLIGSKAAFRVELLHADVEAAMASRSRWLRRQRLPVNLPGVTRRTLARALAVMKGQVCSPQGMIRRRWTTPERWPHRDMWLWDSGFHAIGWRHWDAGLAKETIDAVFDVQASDGFIPHQASPHGKSDITQPPILAYAVGLVHEASPDLAWLQRVYPRLCAYVNWDLQHRDRDGDGLLEWNTDDDPNCHCAESGMDNSPRFDGAPRLGAVDFNCYLARDCEALAELARMIGLREDETHWRGHHRRLCGLINDRLWSDEHEFYCDYDPARESLSPVLSSAGFLPLFCGAATTERAERLTEHLSNPRTFGTRVPIPSVAVCDAEHYSKDLFRGPVWMNVNWLVVQGLRRYGLEAAADRLRRASIREVERLCDAYGTFFEYYDDRGEVDPPQLLRKGKCDPCDGPYHQVVHEFGWTVTLYVDLVMATVVKEQAGCA